MESRTSTRENTASTKSAPVNLQDENVQRVKFACENVLLEKSQLANATSDTMARSKSQPTYEHPSTRDSPSSSRAKSVPAAASPRTETCETRRSPPLRSIHAARSSASTSSPGMSGRAGYGGFGSAAAARAAVERVTGAMRPPGSLSVAINSPSIAERPRRGRNATMVPLFAIDATRT